MSAERWLLLREKLRNVRSCDRKIEMIADGHLQGSFMIQFTFDVQLYGLYEAVLMAPEDAHEGLMDELSDLYEKPAHPIVLPEAHPYELTPRNGKEIKPASVPRTFRPESIWRLQENFIRTITVTKATVDMFERTLPPHISQTYIDKAQRQDLYSAVRDAPYAYREQLAARMIKLHDIPTPPDPKPDTQRHHTVAGKLTRSRDRILVIDKAGNAWTWNLGWGRVKENGDWLDPHKPRLGHTTFQRRIIPADPDDFRRTAFHYTRPWGQWRTTNNGPVAHALFGNGMLKITDGVHAVVLFNDGVKREVMLDNLTQISVRIPRKTAAPTIARKPREKKERPQMTLEDLLKMI